MEFDLIDIKLFSNIAETNGVTYGAERSFLSVPSASTRIKNIELRLGARLLYRNSHGVTLTPAGHSFLHHGQIILQQVARLHGDLQEYAQGIKGHLRIFATTTSVTEFLPALLRKFLQKHPAVNVDLREQGSGDIVRAVYDGMTDIGIVADIVHPQTLVEALPYRRYRHVLAAAPGHPLSKHKAISFAETLKFDHVSLLEGTAMHGFLVRTANEINGSLKIRVQVSHFEAMCRMIESDIGVGLLPEPAAKRYAKGSAIHIIPLTDEWALRKLQMCARSFKKLPLFATDLIDMLLADAACHLKEKSSAGNGASR